MQNLVKAALLTFVLSLHLGVARTQDASPLCRLSESEALKSDKCVRWHFACELPKYRNGLDRYIQDSKSKALSSLTAEDRDYAAAKWTFRASQENCEVFSYQEAEAALRAHTHMPK